VLPSDSIGLGECSSSDGDDEVFDLLFGVANRANLAMIAYSSREETRVSGCSQPRRANSEAALSVTASTHVTAWNVKLFEVARLAQEYSSAATIAWTSA